MSRHRGSPRRAPEASPPASNPSRKTPPHSPSKGGVAGSPRRRGRPRLQARPQGKAFPSRGFQIAVYLVPISGPLISNQLIWIVPSCRGFGDRDVQTIYRAPGGGGPVGYARGPDRGTAPGGEDDARPKNGRSRPVLYHTRRPDGSGRCPIRPGWLHPGPGQGDHRRDPARTRPAAGDQEDGRRRLSPRPVSPYGLGKCADLAKGGGQSGWPDGNPPDAAAGPGRDRGPEPGISRTTPSREAGKSAQGHRRRRSRPPRPARRFSRSDRPRKRAAAAGLDTVLSDLDPHPRSAGYRRRGEADRASQIRAAAG